MQSPTKPSAWSGGWYAALFETALWSVLEGETLHMKAGAPNGSSSSDMEGERGEGGEGAATVAATGLAVATVFTKARSVGVEGTGAKAELCALSSVSAEPRVG